MQAQDQPAFDCSAIDKGGNTVFHRCAIGRDIQLTAELTAEAVALEVCPGQPNHAGRTPLHVLSCYDWRIDEHGTKSGFSADKIRNFLEAANYGGQHANQPDPRGILPLHMAAMLSEICVRELLRVGADPTRATPQGLTPLHLAARARQSNVVGVLIDHIQTGGKGGHSAVATALAATDEVGWTPLHYACRSGRPETVSLLLDRGTSAGLNPVTNDSLPALLDACAEFYQEQSLWQGYRRPDSDDVRSYVLWGLEPEWRDDVVAGVERLDALRPWVLAGRRLREEYVHSSIPEPHSEDERKDEDGRPILEQSNMWAIESYVNNNGCLRNDQDTTRLQPILRMLHTAHKEGRVGDEAETTEFFLETLRTVIDRLGAEKVTTVSLSMTPEVCFHAYTLQRFRDVAAELEIQSSPDGSQVVNTTVPEEDAEFLSRVEVEATRCFYLETDSYKPWHSDGDHIVRQLVRQRRFGVIEQLLLRWATQASLARASNSTREETQDYNTPPWQYWLAAGVRVLVETGLADVLASAHEKASAMVPPVLIYDEERLDGLDESCPLLYTACFNELPSMDIIRFLVEVFGVDVNRRTPTVVITTPDSELEDMLAWRGGYHEEPESLPGQETALHVLARHYRWWGSSLAIPYLISHGADVTVKNDAGETALDIAKQHRGREADLTERRKLPEMLGEFIES